MLVQRKYAVGRSGTAFFLPAHNEAENLHKVVGDVSHYLQGEDHTIIVIDDGSSDETPQVLEALRQQYGIKVITHNVNRGYGAALRSGFTAAYESGHEFIAFCDSDNQFRPADVRLLFEALDEDSTAGAAIGYREYRADGLHRKVSGRVWHWLSSFILDFNVKDVDCGFKLFRREVLAAIDPTKLMGNHAVISPEILARIKRHGFTVVETSMPHFPREHGSQSGMKLSVMLSSILGLFRVRKTIRKETVNGNDHRNAEERFAA